LGFTLDQLLETTGVDSLSNRGMKKAAAKQGAPNLLKLAERCRQAAEVVIDEPPAVDERALIEKTAAVQIIRRTLAEIEQIENGQEKVAAATPPAHQAAFIKAALEAGHEPEAIARFLEQPPGRRPTRPDPTPKKSANSIIG
jgi:Ni,Fe-hydrogenase III large subunit